MTEILSVNAGYFLGYSGRHIDYVKRPWISILGSCEERENLDKLLDIIDEEEPDHVLIQEVDGGSLRSRVGGQQHFLEKESQERFSHGFGRKYRGKIFPGLPIFRFMGNSVLYSSGKSINHRLQTGRKNLVQEIRLEDMSIFSLHLATISPRIRRKQLKEIEKIANKRDEYVLAGDLNLHKGQKEIDALEEQLGEKVRSPGKTFPASNPSQKLDLAASPSGLKITEIRELGDLFSDHRPISFKVEQD